MNDEFKDLEQDIENIDKELTSLGISTKPVALASPQKGRTTHVDYSVNQSSMDLRLGSTGNQLKIYFFNVPEAVQKITDLNNSDDLWKAVDNMKDKVSGDKK